MARGGYKQKRRKDRVAGIGLTIAGIALIACMGGAAYYLKINTTLVDASNCPVAGPRAIHAIIIDRSDAISGQQAQRVRQVLNGLKDNATSGTRFDVFTFDGNSTDELRPELSVCAPGRGKDASELYQNPALIEKKYQEQFARQLDKTVDQLLASSERPRSPIIESLRAAAQTSFGSIPDGTPTKLTLISDMIQNSDGLSQLKNDVSFEALARSETWPRLQPRLRGAETNILYVMRPTALRGRAPVQNRGHQHFWEQLIQASGGQVNSIEPI